MIINLCIVLIGFYISLIISSLARFLETNDPPNGARGCALFSAVLEYFSLTYFVWTVVEAALLLRGVFKGSRDQELSRTALIAIALACWCKHCNEGWEGVCVCVCV